MKRGNHHTFALGSDNELEEGGYIIKVHWWYEEGDRAVSGEMKFPYIKEFKSDIINILARKVNEVLDAIGKDEAKIVVTKVETSDYSSFFVETSVAGVRIRLNLFDNEMEIRGKAYSFVPKVNSKGPRKITVGVAGRLRDLLIEKFREDQDIWEIGILSYLLRGVKWKIRIRRHPQGFDITAYEDGKMKISMGPVDHWDGIRDIIRIYKYKRKYEKAKKEERKRIGQEEEEFESKALDDFMQKKYEKYLKDKALDYTARQHI
ncbi:MAG: hypothetical protein FGF53_05365 [Candidatus Brockarchaeota archaeon]|nr:hypothetical protein [Candidatus Brockarchaeota archaeon]MBO3808956.1 hypothetical protein [Candidatus Brockarchaeota archaeon]